ncbi:MAG: PAS domain-containing protein [Syntrophobacterales bacterium]|jgi:PAS domain S-box-containing protein|nr:PAS domain-containing protein [Syntrophobacterales bacterium]
MSDELRILVLGNEASPVDLIDYELSKLSLPFTEVRVSSRDAFLQILLEAPPDLILIAAQGAGVDGLTALALAQEACPGAPCLLINDAAGPAKATAGRTGTFPAAPLADAGIEVGLAGAIQETFPWRHLEAGGLLTPQDSLKAPWPIPEMVIAFVSPDGRILEFSPGAEHLTGWRKPEVLGKNALEVLFPDAERKLAEDYLKRLASEESGGGFDLPLKAKNGTERSYRWYCNPLADGPDRLTGIIMVGQPAPPAAWERRPQARVSRARPCPRVSQHTMTRRTGTC